MTVSRVREVVNTMFSDLSFDEQRHLYFWGNERVKESVTKKVEHYVPPFDEAYWLPRCAKKEGLTEHELKHKWQTINQTACELGTVTHNFMEYYDGVKSPSSPQEIAGIKYLKDILPEYDIVSKELRMYSRKWKFAGTADLLLIHKETGKLVIADYKTNADIFKTFGMMMPPFGYLENHPYNHYQLQLSYYQIMLEEIGLQISDRILVYLKADSTYKTYSLFDFTTYLEDLLKAA